MPWPSQAVAQTIGPTEAINKRTRQLPVKIDPSATAAVGRPMSLDPIAREVVALRHFERLSPAPRRRSCSGSRRKQGRSGTSAP